MSDLTERLRDLYDTVQHPSVFEAADLIDAIDARHIEKQSFSGGLWVSHGCKDCGMSWPCPTRRLIHPEVDT